MPLIPDNAEDLRRLLWVGKQLREHIIPKLEEIKSHVHATPVAGIMTEVQSVIDDLQALLNAE